MRRTRVLPHLWQKHGRKQSKILTSCQKAIGNPNKLSAAELLEAYPMANPMVHAQANDVNVGADHDFVGLHHGIE